MEMTIIVLNRHSELDSESPMRERPSSCIGDGGCFSAMTEKCYLSHPQSTILKIINN